MKKISFLILAILVVSIASYAYFAIWQFKNDKLKYIYLVSSSFNLTMAHKIESQLERVLGDIQNLVGLLREQEIDHNKSSLIKVIFQNDSSLASFGIYKRLAVAGSYNQIYGIYNKDFMDLNHLKEDVLGVLDTNAIDVYLKNPKPGLNPYYQNQTAQNILTFIIPLDNDKAQLAVFNVNKDFLLDTINSSDMQNSFITGEDGVVLAHKDKSAIGTSVLESPLFLLAKEATVKDGSTEFQLDDGDKTANYIGDFSKLGHGMFLLSQTNREDAFAGLRKINLNTVYFAIFITGLGILIGVIFSKSLTAPLERLMSATESIGAGNYAPDALNIRTNDEVGQLAEYFLNLGKKLNEREVELEKVTELATKDGLTGCYNNRHFRNRLGEFLSLARRHKHQLSLLLLDVDHFKKFNDTYGHQQGDAVLKDLGQILRESTRDTDLVARYGGEEFVVILPETNSLGAKVLGDKIRVNYMNHKIKNINAEGTLQSTCSIGAATFTEDNYNSIDEMIKSADERLYEAKKAGRNRVIV